MSWLEDIFNLIDRGQKAKEKKEYDKILVVLYNLEDEKEHSITLEEIQAKSNFSKNRIQEVMEIAEGRGHILDATDFTTKSKDWILTKDGKVYVEGLIE